MPRLPQQVDVYEADASKARVIINVDGETSNTVIGTV